MDADDLKKRTKLFALRVLKLAAALPKTIEGRAIRSQLVRAGTYVGGELSRDLPCAIKSGFRR
jgi:hypothetical protein